MSKRALLVTIGILALLGGATVLFFVLRGRVPSGTGNDGTPAGVMDQVPPPGTPIAPASATMLPSVALQTGGSPDDQALQKGDVQYVSGEIATDSPYYEPPVLYDPAPPPIPAGNPEDAFRAVVPTAQVGTGAAPPADGNADADADGLTNEQEWQQGTDLQRADTDGDGLSDSEEIRRTRTDPLKSDTDGDGLSDGEEDARWKTDPLNPDTDGDSYADGTEAKAGYNPSGPGKL